MNNEFRRVQSEGQGFDARKKIDQNPVKVKTRGQGFDPKNLAFLLVPGLMLVKGVGKIFRGKNGMAVTPMPNTQAPFTPNIIPPVQIINPIPVKNKEKKEKVIQKRYIRKRDIEKTRELLENLKRSDQKINFNEIEKKIPEKKEEKNNLQIALWTENPFKQVLEEPIALPWRDKKDLQMVIYNKIQNQKPKRYKLAAPLAKPEPFPTKKLELPITIFNPNPKFKFPESPKALTWEPKITKTRTVLINRKPKQTKGLNVNAWPSDVDFKFNDIPEKEIKTPKKKIKKKKSSNSEPLPRVKKRRKQPRFKTPQPGSRLVQPEMNFGKLPKGTYRKEVIGVSNENRYFSPPHKIGSK